MKTLITGGAGFIGSHLSEACLAEGDEVTVLDNLSVGRLSNLKTLRSSSRFRFIEGDVSDAVIVDEAMRGIDRVFHLAALADIVPSIERPLDYYRANVGGTFQVLEAARRHGIQKLVYAASSSCYGLATQFPTPETAKIDPQYPYALTKWMGEQAVLHWGKVYRLPVISLRLFNVYGPRARTSGTYGAVFGVFLAQKRNGQPFTRVGDGTQTRDFTYVTDVVSALLAAAKSQITQEVFNVGSGGTYSVNHLIELLGGDYIDLPKRPAEPDCTYADITKIQTQLNWAPKTSFKTGVTHLLTHLDEWQDAPVWNKATIETATTAWFQHLVP